MSDDGIWLSLIVEGELTEVDWIGLEGRASQDLFLSTLPLSPILPILALDDPPPHPIPSPNPPLSPFVQLPKGLVINSTYLIQSPTRDLDALSTFRPTSTSQPTLPLSNHVRKIQARSQWLQLWRNVEQGPPDRSVLQSHTYPTTIDTPGPSRFHRSLPLTRPPFMSCSSRLLDAIHPLNPLCLVSFFS